MVTDAVHPDRQQVTDGSASDSPAAAGSICKSLQFTKQDYASRTGFNFGDSWMVSWGGDGKTYTNFSDGKFFEGDWQTNAILTIDDDPPNVKASSFVKVSANPLMVRKAPSWAYYITSTILIGNTMYVAVVDIFETGLGARAAGIGRSDDLGKTLVYDRSKPMWPRGGKKPFVYPFLLPERSRLLGEHGWLHVHVRV